MSRDKNVLIGKKLLKVFVAKDKGSIKFEIKDGAKKGSVVARADGDCCSNTWIESVESPSNALGGVVTNVEDIDMPGDEEAAKEHECLQFYGCKITTDKGSFVIDYRNSSNGYYGGSLSWPGEYFYGGVHGQNGNDSEDWTEVK